MKNISLARALAAATVAAKAAGQLMRQHWRSPKRVNSSSRYDIKLELDVRAQRIIERKLRAVFPNIPLLAEEGDSGDVEQAYRWVVDPIDGTINFAHGIPHACVSIALQASVAASRQSAAVPATRKMTAALCRDAATPRTGDYEAVVGVVYDPFADELWTAIQGKPARLNGRVIHVSTRTKLAECLVTTGFAKTRESLDEMLPYFAKLAYSVRKIRIMGAAALGLTYVASGRLDAYLEARVSLWDIAAGGLIIECAGGEFLCEPLAEPRAYRISASNGLIRRKLERLRPTFKPGNRG